MPDTASGFRPPKRPAPDITTFAAGGRKMRNRAYLVVSSALIYTRCTVNAYGDRHQNRGAYMTARVAQTIDRVCQNDDI